MITLEKELTQAEKAVQRNGFMRVAPHPTHEDLRFQIRSLNEEIYSRAVKLQTRDLNLIKIAVDAVPHMIYEIELMKELITIYEQLIDYKEYKSRYQYS